MSIKTKVLSSFLLLILIGSWQKSFAKDDTIAETKEHYHTAKQELENMLTGKSPLSYEKAIFTLENAWYEGALDYAAFQQVLNFHVYNIKNLVSANKKEQGDFFKPTLLKTAEEKKAAYNKVLTNWAIFTYITDTTQIVWRNEDYYHLPYKYSKEDPLGTTDWRNTQVSHLMSYGKGNCFALSSLFKILSDRLSSDAVLCTVPGHIYVRHADENGTYFNVELASRSFPGTGTLQTLSYTTDAALKNNIALRELDEKQAIALCLVYLGKSYQYKFETADDDFILQCAAAALNHDPLNLNAMLLKAGVLEGRICNKTPGSEELLKTYESLIARIYDLGYREMPAGMKNMLLGGYNKRSIDDVSEHYTAGTFQRLGENQERYASLSWGLFDERHTAKPIEKYGRTLFSTKDKRIIGFENTDELFNHYTFDPVVFALNIDPLAAKYPGISPYVFCADNPIMYIDPDGREIVGVTRGDAIKMREDIYKVLAAPKFDQVRALIDVKGKTFKPIGAEALSTSLSGASLSDDERTYVNMVANTINSKEIQKVEYVDVSSMTSPEGAAAFRDNMNKLQPGAGDIMTPGGDLRAGLLEGLGKEGYNVPTENGSHSFILSGGNVKHDDRAITSGHEVFGHGIPSSRKESPEQNNNNAIRTDNLIRRILGHPQRDGKDHAGANNITDPYALPYEK